jgi:hypothetical protein
MSMEKRCRRKRVFKGGKKIPHEHGKEAEEEECFLWILRARMLFIQLFDFEKVLPVDRHHLFMCVCVCVCVYIYILY